MQPTVTKREASWEVPFFLLCLTLLLAVRLYALIDRYAVNTLFFDQWDLYNALFNQTGPVEKFLWQHGPQRQGLALFITQWVADWSAWNTRVEGLAIGGIVLAALGLSFWLKRRLAGEWHWSDAALPMLFLTPAAYETYVGTPNPSHGSLPLLLLMGFALAWTVGPLPVRMGLIALLHVLLIYTGFTVLMAVITPVLLAVEIWRPAPAPGARWWALLAFSVVMLANLTFLLDFRCDTANPTFQWFHSRWWEYPQFMALMLANVLGVEGVRTGALLGSGLLLLMLGVMGWHLLAWRRSRSASSVVIFTLTAFTLLFVAQTSYGRVSLGMGGSQTSRYVLYLVPGLLGVLLHWQAAIRSRLVLAALVLLIASGSFVSPLHQRGMEWFCHGKQAWKAVYRQSGCIATADRLTGFPIHPQPAATQLEAKLAFLRRQGLNLFATSD